MYSVVPHQQTVAKEGLEAHPNLEPSLGHVLLTKVDKELN